MVNSLKMGVVLCSAFPWDNSMPQGTQKDETEVGTSGDGASLQDSSKAWSAVGEKNFSKDEIVTLR